ncbi:uncharacterized protein [Amphiura filiformis]|uniref:uncharacterized protein n=1 Tax=Amphiura filiformis TaxID=82378 RepID=UPI003B224EAA
MDINLRQTFCLCWALFLITVCHSQCPNPATFEVVPEDEYDRDFRSVTPGGRPVGFEFKILYYEADGQPNPCYEIPNTGDRRVEIMAEPDGGASSQLCVRDQLGRELCDTRIYDCRQANADSLNLEFFCDAASCDESDVRMWVRFAVSPPADELDPELWCDSRDTGEYPSSLAAPLPPGVSLKPAPPAEDPTDGVGRLIGTPVLMVVMLFAVVLLRVL